VVKNVYYTSRKKNQLLKNWGLNCNKITHIPYIGICHSTKWDGGFNIEECKEEEKKLFYSDLNEMIMFLKDFMFKMNITKAIIGRFHRSKWFEQWSDLDKIDVYIKLKNTLSQYNLKNNSKKGLEIDVIEQQGSIYSVIEGGFRYVSCISIYFPEVGILVEPTHNFELMFFTKEIDSCKNQLYKNLPKYSNLCLYEAVMWESD